MDQNARLSFAAAVCLLGGAAHAQSLGTAFTYQGEVSESGQPATGVFDLRFTLFNSDLNQQVGPVICADNVAVSGGRFTVQLDFGVSPSDADHELQLQIRRDTGLACANLAGFTTLGPNQPVTGAPLALTAKKASDADRLGGQLPSFYSSAANISTGTLNDARLSTNVPRMNSAAAQTFTGPISFSGSTQFTSMSVQNITITGGTLAGNGAGITGITANNLTTGTLNDLRLSTNIPRLNATNTFLQNCIFSNAVSVGGALNAGSIALATPVARTLVVSAVELGNGLLTLSRPLNNPPHSADSSPAPLVRV